MPQEKLHIEIAEPCSQDWSGMTAGEKGRFCNACEKVVVDFTTMSDSEVLNFFKEKTNEKTCGRFYRNQIDQPIIVDTPQKVFWGVRVLRQVAASLLFLQSFLYNDSVFAKSKPAIEIVVDDELSTEGKTVIKGRLLDYHSSKPVSGVKVMIDSTDYYCVTNKDGRFYIATTNKIEGELILKTEYIDSTSYIAGSIILDEKGTYEELTNKEVLLYRYPEAELEEMTIIEYIYPLIDMGYTSGITITGDVTETMPHRKTDKPTRGVSSQKNTFWQRMTKIFRRK